MKSDPCRGPQRLPADAKLEGLPIMDCGEQVLCNPLLFGVKRNCEIKQQTGSADSHEATRACLAKSFPLCVPKSKYATRDCAQAAASEEYVVSALAIVKENPDAWQEYLTSFYELCDDHMIAFNQFVTTKNGAPREEAEKAVRDDLDQTCGYARKRLKEISDKYRSYDISARPEKKKAPESAPAPATGGTQGKK